MATLSASFLQLDGTSLVQSLSASWLQLQGAPASHVLNASWLQLQGAPIVSIPADPSAVGGDAAIDSF